MAQRKRRVKYFVIILIFIIYFLTAARPIPKETVLTPAWLSSLGSVHITGLPDEFINDDETREHGLHFLSDRSDLNINIDTAPVPFTLYSRFGFVNAAGQFALNKIKSNEIYLSQNMWTEYGAEPSSITINKIDDNSEIKINDPKGYPVLLDNRIFILGSEHNSLSEIDSDGNIFWTYEFGAPLTAIDAAADLVVTGSLDGAIEVFNLSGERIFYFEPGGSQYSVILGCAMSRNGMRIGVICGIEPQRFLLLERLGNSGDYKVVYHDPLETGFRRPVRVQFIDDDQRIVFERAGGLGCYNIKSRHKMFIPLDGEITAFDGSGENGFFFLTTSHNQRIMKLIGIKFPPEKLINLSKMEAKDTVFIKALFKSDDVYIGRISPMLIAGGGTSLISFVLEEK